MSCILGSAGQLFWTGSIVLNLSTVALYVMLWLFIRCNAHSSAVNSPTALRVSRSIAAITVVVLVGWGLNALVKAYLPSIFTLQQFNVWVVSMWSGTLMIIATTLNFPILYAVK